MSKINIIYWTQTGNTAAMAYAIAEGIKAGGKEADIMEVGNASANALKDEKIYVLGCPAMGDEVLEESEMEPFMEELEAFVGGKKVVLFGSYGWGDGAWMREWVDRMKAAGAVVVNNEGLMCHEAPSEEDLNQCRALGKQLASL